MTAAGNFKKFESSWVRTDNLLGRARIRNTMKQQEKSLIDLMKDEIVQRLRTRAEHFEAKADKATPERSIQLSKTAKELRDCATSIRLNSWDDMDEI